MNTENTMELSWHQTQAIHRQWRTRNLPAHIEGTDWLRTGKALCGTKNPRVRIDAQHRHNAANKPCKRCVAIADKMKWKPSLPHFAAPTKHAQPVHPNTSTNEHLRK